MSKKCPKNVQKSSKNHSNSLGFTRSNYSFKNIKWKSQFSDSSSSACPIEWQRTLKNELRNWTLNMNLKNEHEIDNDLLLARFCGLGVAPFPFPVQLATSKCRFCSIWSDLGVSGLVVFRPNPLMPLGSTRGSARWWWWTVFRLVWTDIGCNCLFWPLSGPKFSEVVELNLRHVLNWKKSVSKDHSGVRSYATLAFNKCTCLGWWE